MTVNIFSQKRQSFQYTLYICWSLLHFKPQILKNMSNMIRKKYKTVLTHFHQDSVRSFYIVLASVLVSALGSTIIITGVWPYLEVVKYDFTKCNLSFDTIWYFFCNDTKFSQYSYMFTFIFHFSNNFVLVSCLLLFYLWI